METDKKEILKGTASYVGREINSRKYLSQQDLIKLLVPARYVLEGNTVFLEKLDKNTKNVLEKVRIGDIEWWNRAEKYRTTASAKINSNIKYIGCPASCGLCPYHQNYTALLNIVLTNRCNLNCPYCFFYSEKAGYVYEPSLEQILSMVENAKKFNGGKLYAVQLTGGEPTLRRDLEYIIREIKEKGVRHIQLNTNAVRIGIMYYNNPSEAVEYVRRLRKAGMNTVYMSFDAVGPKNFKNYYETPFALEAFYKGGARSVVLVPTLINGWNFPDEVGKIIRFAARNMDVVRGVNFQPVSFVGYMTRKEIEEVEKRRVTQSDLEIVVKQQLGIPRDSWRPIPFVLPLLYLLGKEDLGFYNNPLCGEATYLIVEFNNDNVKFHPITDYIDVDRLYEDTKDAINTSFAKRTVLRMRVLANLLKGRYIIEEKLPDGTKITDLLKDLFIKRDYSSAGEIHYKLLYIGSMHFMDPFNYDVHRVMRCSIHYASPDGRVIPFCAYNVFPSVYRDNILRRYSLPEEEARKKLEENKIFYKEVAEFRKKDNLKEIVKHPVFIRRYTI